MNQACYLNHVKKIFMNSNEIKGMEFEKKNEYL